MRYYKVLYDFTASESVELSVRKNDIVFTSNDDAVVHDGWIKVLMANDERKTGFVPHSYLQEYPEGGRHNSQSTARPPDSAISSVTASGAPSVSSSTRSTDSFSNFAVASNLDGILASHNNENLQQRQQQQIEQQQHVLKQQQPAKERNSPNGVLSGNGSSASAEKNDRDKRITPSRLFNEENNSNNIVNSNNINSSSQNGRTRRSGSITASAASMATGVPVSNVNINDVGTTNLKYVSSNRNCGGNNISYSTSNLSSEDFLHNPAIVVEAFMKNEVYFKQLMKQRQEALSRMESALSEAVVNIAACKDKNATLNRKLRDLDQCVERERRKWKERVEEEKIQIQRNASNAASLLGITSNNICTVTTTRVYEASQ